MEILKLFYAVFGTIGVILILITLLYSLIINRKKMKEENKIQVSLEVKNKKQFIKIHITGQFGTLEIPVDENINATLLDLDNQLESTLEIANLLIINNKVKP